MVDADGQMMASQQQQYCEVPECTGQEVGSKG